MGTLPFRVTLIGAGQVGQAIAKALRAKGGTARLLPLRVGLPKRIGQPDLIVLCVRDGQIADTALALSRSGLNKNTIVAQVSGVHGPEVLDVLRPLCRGVAQLHPFSSIRSVGHPRHFAGAYFLGVGNAAALVVLRRLVRLLGARLVAGAHVDRARYHLAAALAANGTVALLDVALRQLAQAGIDPAIGLKMLMDLEHSVLHNVGRLGVGAALTGPVRRGDVGTIQRHLETLRDAKPSTRELYRALVGAQIDIVRTLGALDPDVLRRMRRLVSSARR